MYTIGMRGVKDVYMARLYHNQSRGMVTTTHSGLSINGYHWNEGPLMMSIDVCHPRWQEVERAHVYCGRQVAYKSPMVANFPSPVIFLFYARNFASSQDKS